MNHRTVIRDEQATLQTGDLTTLGTPTRGSMWIAFPDEIPMAVMGLRGASCHTDVPAMHACRLGAESIVSKKVDGTYRSGPCADVLVRLGSLCPTLLSSGLVF